MSDQPDVAALVTQIENYTAEQNPADSPCPRGFDLLRSCLAVLKGQTERDERLEQLKPSAHMGVSVEDSYRLLVEIFAEVQTSHTAISCRAPGTHGLGIRDRVLSLLAQLNDSDSLMRLKTIRTLATATKKVLDEESVASLIMALSAPPASTPEPQK
jgi:hypothetical protein